VIIVSCKKDGSKLKKYYRDRALAKVRSMVQYPDAWDQYQRNLTVVTKMQEPQVVLMKNGRFPCFVNERITQLFVANMTACARNCARGVN
jgi:hypothetical protein